MARVKPASSGRGFRILLYHAVDEPDPGDRLSLRVQPEAFRAQMEFLQTGGYQVVPLRSLLDRLNSGDAAGVAITFDDGYRSQLHAAAILGEFGFPATFFVVVRFLNGVRNGTHYWEKWEHMKWEDLRALSSRGFEIGAHSLSHVPLTRCSPVRLQEEVAGARVQLEDRLGWAVVSFSYPHGAHNDAVRHAVQEAGYQLACTSVCGANHSPWSCFELRRTEISGVDRLEDFRQKLEGKYDWLGYWQRWPPRHA